MAQAQRQEQITPADELRALLEQSEKLVGRLRGESANALCLLENLDRVAALWPELAAAGVDLRPEAGRWETLQANVHKQAPSIVRALAAAGGVAAQRDRHQAAEPVPWWWQLDRELRERRIRRLRKMVRIGVVAVLVVVIAVFAFNKLFPTDPNVSASAAQQMAGQRKIDAGDLPGAVVDFQEAAALTPDSADPWLWLAATQQKLGQAAQADEGFARAQALSKKPIEFYLGRAPVYMALKMWDQAQADLDAALKIDPQEPRTYLLLANIDENQGRYEEGVNALQQASDLAEARKDSELVAVARYRMAMMLQQMQAQMPMGPSPAPSSAP